MAGFGCTLDGLVHIIQGGSVNNSIGHVLRKLCDMEVNDAVDFGVAVVPDLDLGPYIKHVGVFHHEPKPVDRAGSFYNMAGRNTMSHKKIQWKT